MNVEDFLASLTAWARTQPTLRALFVIGSQARAGAADAESDVDLVLVTDDPEHYLRGEWLSELGRPVLSFVQPLNVVERRVLFDSGLAVDFGVVPTDALPMIAEDPGMRGSPPRARAVRMLHDTIGLGPLAERFASQPIPPYPRDRAKQVSHEFWFFALLAAKKLRRGEIYIAKNHLEIDMKPMLVEVLTECVRLRAPEREIWGGGRYLERWLDADELAALGRTYARYDRSDIARAVKESADMFTRLESELWKRADLGALVDHEDVRARLAALLAS